MSDAFPATTISRARRGLSPRRVLLSALLGPIALITVLGCIVEARDASRADGGTMHIEISGRLSIGISPWVTRSIEGDPCTNPRLHRGWIDHEGMSAKPDCIEGKTFNVSRDRFLWLTVWRFAEPVDCLDSM